MGKISSIFVPEWAGQIWVRGLTGEELWEMDCEDRGGDTAWIVTCGAVDQDGKQLFSKDEVAALGKKSSSALWRLRASILEKSGLAVGGIEKKVASLRSNHRLSFWPKLAKALGKTIGELRAGLDADEFGFWQAFDVVDPFGEWRADLRNAILCMIVANLARGKNSKAFRVEDFLPDFSKKEEEARVQSPEEMQLMAIAWTGFHGGTIIDNRKK